MAQLALGLLVAIVGWVLLLIGIALGNVRVGLIGTGTLFLAEMM